MLSLNKIIYIHTYIFFCLINLTNQETEILSITIKDKTWKFTLNDSPNAKILHEKLMSKKKMELDFSVVKAGTINSLIWSGTSLQFNALDESASDGPYKKYHIYAGHNEGNSVLYIVLGDTSGLKCDDIGEITDGIDDLTEFDSFFKGKSTSDDIKLTFKLETETKQSLTISIVTLALIVSSFGIAIFIVIIIFLFHLPGWWRG